jgi:hypothetical protein
MRVKRYYLSKRPGMSHSSNRVELEDQCNKIKELGGTNVYQADQFGRCNQPTVVCFNASDEVKNAIASYFDAGYIVHYHWRYKTGEDCLNDVL